MSQSHVQVSNLPPIHIANVQEALAANGDSTISLISSDEEEVISCYDNGDVQPSISIINSSDVVIGSVTQFHGPVTIVQHIPAIEDLKQNGADGIKNKAKLVIGDTVQVTKPRQHTRLPRRLLLCFATVTITLFIIVLTLILAMDTAASDMPREFPNPYNLTDHMYYTQSEWGGRAPLWVTAMEPPVRWVIISHTVGEQCRTFAACSSQMRLFQDMHVADGSPNIGYNFVIGADGNVYEGRGWFTQNFHAFEPNSLSISFAGNYVYDELTDDMVDVFEQLLVLAVDLEVISPNYLLIAHNQTLVTLSPGPNIYGVIKNFPNFFEDQRPRDSYGANLNNFDTTSEASESAKPSKLPCMSLKILLISCIAVISITIVALVLVFVPFTTTKDEEPYVDTSNRNLSNHFYYAVEEWGGRQPLWVTPIINPVTWIIVSHTVGPQCQSFATCSRQMRLMQDMHVANGNPNIGYNFVIGGDGNVYEGRGWTGQNFHLFSPSSLAISFDGNYVHDVLSEEMIDVFEELLQLGVELEIIKPEFRIVGHNQTFATLSPGQNVYSVISQMPNFYERLRPGMGPG